MYDYSVPTQGVRNAESLLESAAQKIAAPPQQVLSGDSGDRLSLSDNYLTALITVDQAKFAAKANLRVISTEQELDHTTLDLFA
jgi:hypothetical protein